MIKCRAIKHIRGLSSTSALNWKLWTPLIRIRIRWVKTSGVWEKVSSFCVCLGGEYNLNVLSAWLWCKHTIIIMTIKREKSSEWKSCNMKIIWLGYKLQGERTRTLLESTSNSFTWYKTFHRAIFFLEWI